MPELEGVFRRPFRQQVAAFRLRLQELIPTTRWDDISRAQHDRGFMIAGARDADLLADLAAAVDKAISQGTTLEEFKRDFRGIVDRRGWHGWTGEGTKGGEAWRMKTIYRTNIMTSYHAGRFAQLKEAGFKYWVYRHSGAVEPREQHLAWNGLILPADHEFWATHYPPNGWGCGCYVNGAHSRKLATLVGGNPAVKLPANWKSLNPRTGAPIGIDKLWDYAPGASAFDDINFLAAKSEVLPPQLSIDLIQSWVLGGLFEKWLSKPVGNFPLFRLPDAQVSQLGAKSNVALMSPQTAAKQLRKHPELTASEYANAQETVLNATDIVQDNLGPLIFIRQEPNGGHVFVVKATRSGAAIFVTSVRRLPSNPAARARELRRLLRKGN